MKFCALHCKRSGTAVPVYVNATLISRILPVDEINREGGVSATVIFCGGDWMTVLETADEVLAILESLE